MSDLRIAPRRIEDYAIVGDCETAALIAINGSIDWLCWPRFDSGACFAALLGGSEHGRWLIAPKDETATRVTRRYLGSSLILVTTFENTTGAVELVDFMPPGDGAHLVRIVVGRLGRVDFQTELVVRFNYGAAVPWVNRLDDGERPWRQANRPAHHRRFTPLKERQQRHARAITGDTRRSPPSRRRSGAAACRSRTSCTRSFGPTR